jgi:exonuclease SbcD
VTEARAEPLLACLQALASQEPEAIAERVLRGQEVPDGGECIDTAVTLSPPMADLEPALSF